MTTATMTRTDTMLATRKGPRPGVEFTYTTTCCGSVVIDRTKAHHAPRGKVRCPVCGGWCKVG